MTTNNVIQLSRERIQANANKNLFNPTEKPHKENLGDAIEKRRVEIGQHWGASKDRSVSDIASLIEQDISILIQQEVLPQGIYNVLHNESTYSRCITISIESLEVDQLYSRDVVNFISSDVHSCSDIEFSGEVEKYLLKLHEVSNQYNRRMFDPMGNEFYCHFKTNVVFASAFQVLRFTSEAGML